MKADKVIIGNIYTVDRNEPKAQAVAIAGGELVILHEIYNERWVRVTDNFEQAVLGTWEAQVTEAGKPQTWRWEFKASGTYVFSLKIGDAPWQVFEDHMSDYFVDGPLLCTRWQNTAESNMAF